jgi:5-methylthioadenosine/S-adenosylhomocysteine deaminase
MVEAALAAYEEVGIRCVMSLQVGNRPAIDCLPGIRQTMPDELQPLISGKAPAAADFLSFVRGPLEAAPRPRLTWAIAPGSPQRCSFDLLAGLGEIAATHGLPLVTHVNESKLQVFLAEELYAEFGGSVLDYLEAAGVFDRRLSMAHGIWFDDREVDRIAAAGAAVATCPASNLKLKSGVAPHRALQAAGVRLSLGCDNVSAGDNQNIFEAMRLLVHLNSGKGATSAGLTARDALNAATQGGADVLGLGETIGSIAVGRQADLTVLDLTDLAYLPLNDAVRQIVYAEGGRAVRDVLVDGRILVRDRRITTVDYGTLVEDAVDLADAVRRDYREHFERMAPAIAFIADTARRESARPLPYARWVSASDDRISRQ